MLGFRDTTLMLIAVLGLWSFTNLEMMNAMLRVDERAGTFIRASLINVALTVSLSVYLIVVRDQGARGLLAGNFAASTIVLLGPAVGPARPRGLAAHRPPAPAGAAALRPAHGARRGVGVRAEHRRSPVPVPRGERGRRRPLLVGGEAVGGGDPVTRAFQYAWPPLAYSIRDDEQARRFYALVATYYVVFAGTVVAALTLLGRWAVRLLAAPEFFPAYAALPWVALGWALYGLFLVLVVMAGRAKVTTRNFPAALAGLAVNVVLLVVLVAAAGDRGRGHRAVRRLRGHAGGACTR